MHWTVSAIFVILISLEKITGNFANIIRAGLDLSSFSRKNGIYFPIKISFIKQNTLEILCASPWPTPSFD